MVVGAFPIVKLGALLLKQISKPIANVVKESAKSHPFFRTYFCMPPAQFYNWCEVKAKMWILNLGRPVNIPVLNEAMAIELGANLLGEGIVFIIAAGVLVSEYNRSAKKEAAKEQARKDEISSVINQVQELYFRLEKQDAQLREMHRLLVDYKSPWLKGNKNSPEPPTESPPPSPPTISPQPTRSDPKIKLANINNLSNSNMRNSERMGLILHAVHTMEEEIVGNDDSSFRENGILTNALLYIQRDVYRWPITVTA